LSIVQKRREARKTIVRIAKHAPGVPLRGAICVTVKGSFPATINKTRNTKIPHEIYHFSFLLLVLIRKQTPFTEFRNVGEMEGPGKLMKMK